MELYLFRHGDAEDAPPGKPDSSRALTAKGVERSASVAKMARDAGVTPSLIVSSPYLRAMQTAEVAAKEFGWNGEIVQLQSLVPHGAPESVWSDLRDLHDETAILLAGHEPLMASLAAYLLDAPGLRVDMKKSAMIRIDVAGMGTAPRGVLRWMVVPRLT
ncbi:MAG TPA: phosphohistidine phosphatase SixA [Bryobacteraceae bacterium]|jgi:phosphohistidine phosphatase